MDSSIKNYSIIPFPDAMSPVPMDEVYRGRVYLIDGGRTQIVGEDGTTWAVAGPSALVHAVGDTYDRLIIQSANTVTAKSLLWEIYSKTIELTDYGVDLSEIIYIPKLIELATGKPNTSGQNQTS